MPRYIDADEFVKRVIQYPHQSTKTIGLALADTPTVDVPERNVGKWIDDCTCSICNWIHEDDKGFALLTDYHFCPNCGADMRKETEDANKID